MKLGEKGSAQGKWLIAALSFVCLGVFVLRSFRSEMPHEEDVSSSFAPSAVSEAPIPSAAPVPRVTPIAPVAPVRTETLSVQCKELLRDLKEVDLKTLAKASALPTEIPVPTECQGGDVSSELSQALGKYKMACDALHAFSDDRLSEDEASKRNQTCLVALAELRAQLSWVETAGLKTARVSEPKLLEDRLVNALSKGDVNQTLEAAKRLLELEPRHKGASRALMNAYLELASRYNGTRQDPFWREARQAIRLGMRGAALSSDESIRARLYADYLQYKNVNRLMRQADLAAQEFPDAAAPYLFKAMAAFQKKRKAEAIAFLQEYGRRSQDPQANAAIQRIQSGQPQPFQFSFLAPLNLLDLTAD